MATLVIRHPDGSEHEHEISGELKIGRQEGTNDLILTEGGVSRRHATFLEEGGKVLVRDESSANGTFVDGQRISEPTPLTSKSEVLLGEYSIRLKAPARAARKSAARDAEAPVGLADEAPSATRAMPSAKRSAGAGASSLTRRPRPGASAGASAPPPAGLVLKGLTGPWANQKFPVQGKITVGRQAPAAVVLEDDSVSRRHAEVELTPGGVMLRDLGSANGTLVNGEPVGTEQVALQLGDTVSFGMVEVVLEDAAGASLARRNRSEVPTRRATGAQEVPAEGDEAPPAAAGSRKRLLVVAGAVVGVLLVAGIAKTAMSGGSHSAPGRDVPMAATPVQAENPADQVQEALSQCRSYSSSDMGSEPDWNKAEAACGKALEIDPINTEANTLMRRIKVEKEAAGFFAQGQKALGRLKEEEALDAFKKITKDSSYFRRAKPKVQEAMAQVLKRSQDDCKRYLADAQWSAAVPRCERYMGLACQKMSREELEPPIGYKLVLARDRRLKKNEWRPKDKMYLDFLNARQRVDPNAAPWHCPVADITAEDETAPDPKKLVEENFKQRFPNKSMLAAMMDYWAGRGSEALATLQRVRNNYELAQLHEETTKLITSVSNVDQLFKTGEGFLQNEDVEKAADSFQEALDIDKTLMDTLVDTRPSFYRRNIQQDIASKAIVRGKYWDERGDQRHACRVWKLGFHFYAGNTDLNSQVGKCSTRGLKALKSAQTCSDLDVALDFAVPGDDLEGKVAEKKKENGC